MRLLGIRGLISQSSEQFVSGLLSLMGGSHAGSVRPSPAAVRQRPVLIGASVALLLSLGAVLLLRPDRRSAWDQASLSRDLPKKNTPGQRGLWADQLRPLLREADALGAEPSGPAERLAWRQAQCAINRRLQELQWQFGRPVETAQQMGRPPACEQLAGKL